MTVRMGHVTVRVLMGVRLGDTEVTPPDCSVRIYKLTTNQLLMIM